MIQSQKFDGYPKLAAMMDGSHGVAIFRRFGEMNIQNLLFLQSEISHLLDEYQDIARIDHASGDSNRANFSKEWIKLAKSSGPADHALIQTSQLLQHPAPPKQQVEVLRQWLKHPDKGMNFLLSADARTWKKENERDLIALATDACQEDAFTRWVTNQPLTLFHQYIGERIYARSQPDDEEAGFVRYSDTKLARLSGGLGTGLGSALTMTSVIVLNYINRMVVRLVVIAIFMVLFSLLLSVFTKSRKIEVFAATCAFASVQVVFVGTK